MGCCSSVNQSTRTNVSNNPPANLSKIKMVLNTKYSPILELTHNLNVNNKYDIYFTYDSSHIYKLETAFTGEGIKNTNSYISKVSPEEIKKLRDEFWGNE